MFINAEPPKSKPFGRLIAWDPVAQKEAWRVEHVSPWNGGTLTTAGNLVFQGTADGRFVAYNAKTGEKLWETPTGTGVVAAPSTYEVDGKQYVSIAVGWGGVYGIAARATERKGPGTVYTFAVGGNATTPEFVAVPDGRAAAGRASTTRPSARPARCCTSATASSATACRAWTAAATSRTSATRRARLIDEPRQVVFKGPAMEHGMPDFTGKLTARRRREDQGLHPGHGRRGPAEVGACQRGFPRWEPAALLGHSSRAELTRPTINNIPGEPAP